MKEELLASFQAAAAVDEPAFLLSLAAAAAGLLGMIGVLWRKPPRERHNQNMLIAMLLFFVFIIGASTAFFTWLRQQQLKPVNIYTDRIETPFGEAPFQRIRNAKIMAHSEGSPLGAYNRNQTRLLTIIERDGKTHVMSESDYPIERILNQLREAVKAWEEEATE